MREGRWDLILLGAARIFHFMRLVMPIIMHYKVKILMNKVLCRKVPPEEWESMHKYYAPRALAIAERMQGFYIKIGQHLATTMTNNVPVVYVECFKSLLEHCPSQPFSVVKAIVEKELGPMDKTFESFTEAPLNTASTGQVHTAKLICGHDVVVKVQHPNAEWTFGVDLQVFLACTEIFAPQALGIVRQIKKNLVNEFDYEREAAQQREAGDHLKGYSNIVVPEPVDALHPVSPTPKGLCTKRVLVMDRLFGMSLADWGRAHLESQARLQGKSVRELQAEYMSKSTSDMERMRPSALGLGAYFMVSRGADIACNTMLFLYNWGLGYMLRRGVKYVETALPPNIHVITQDLMEAQGHMLFHSGFVNCDPHAGNVMLLNDGRIGLIDWGQVVRLTIQQRCIMAGLYIAVADKDDIMSADCMRALGGRTKHDWDWTQATWAKLVTWSVQECELNLFERLSEVMDKVDMTVKEADSVFIMTFKNQLYTRQVAAMLGFFSINSAVALRRMAEETLRDAGWPVPKTRRTTIPMPQIVQELMNDTAPPGLVANNSRSEEVERHDFSGWELILPATLPPLASYGVLSLLRLVQVPQAVRGLALLALCLGVSLCMVVFFRRKFALRAGLRKELTLSPGFCPDNWELALTSM